MNKTGHLIAELRKKAGYTQKTLAEALHITDKAVSKWERGLSFPDVALLPKLSILLSTDIERFLMHQGGREEWRGLLDLNRYHVDLSERIYDKPLVYYLLSHFLLMDIREIYIRTDPENMRYLSEPVFGDFGFSFHFDLPDDPSASLMVLNRPVFVFGSDLSRIYHGIMMAGKTTKLVPDNQKENFLFCIAEDVPNYLKNAEEIYKNATPKTLGRGMVCIEADNIEHLADIAVFVRTYQRNSGLLLASLEEIAYRKGILAEERFQELASRSCNVDYLRKLLPVEQF